MRTVEISVTTDHIARGQPGCSVYCPVALAIKETLHPLSVHVDEEFIAFGVPGGGYDFTATPEEVWCFADEFDDGIPVRPFTFTLEVPETVAA